MADNDKTLEIGLPDLPPHCHRIGPFSMPDWEQGGEKTEYQLTLNDTEYLVPLPKGFMVGKNLQCVLDIRFNVIGQPSDSRIFLVDDNKIIRSTNWQIVQHRMPLFEPDITPPDNLSLGSLRI